MYPKGGIQIEGLGGTDIDNQPEVFNSPTVGGLALEFHRRLSQYYGRLERLERCMNERIKDADVWRFESRVAEQIIKEWLAEYPEITIIKVTQFGKLYFHLPLRFSRASLTQRVRWFETEAESAH